MMNFSTEWIIGGLWIGQLVGVMTLGLLIVMLTPAYRSFVTLDRERDVTGQEDK